MSFFYFLSLDYVAATLLIGGVGHVLGISRFRDLVRNHNIVPSRFATATAVLVIAFELMAGSASLAVLLNQQIAPRSSLVFAICAVAGSAFAFYIWRLLSHPEGVSSCGCSPFAGPLTPISIVPALALLLMSLLGLLAAGLGFGQSLAVTYELLGIAVALPIAWGVTLALLVLLLPASMPSLATNGRW